MAKYDYLVFVGRFQPLHRGHEAVIRRALELADRVIVVLGSARRPCDLHNPWSTEFRAKMILKAFEPECIVRDRVSVISMEDYSYSDGEWVQVLRHKIEERVKWHFLEKKPVIGLIGHSKDHTSYYLKSFPMWGSEEVPGYTDDRLLSSTWIREQLFLAPESDLPENLVHPGVMEVLRQTQDTIFRFHLEFNQVADYRAKYGVGPFNAGDAMIVRNRHVLLVKRGKWPGEGLWALPGGFQEPWETLTQTARREAEEETDMFLPQPPDASGLFDDPRRDVRAHIISHTRRWTIQDDVFTNPVAGDDAAEVWWAPEAEIQPEIMYSDHYHIIRNMLRRTA